MTDVQISALVMAIIVIAALSYRIWRISSYSYKSFKRFNAAIQSGDKKKAQEIMDANLKKVAERKAKVKQLVTTDTYNKICAILFSYDPIGLNFESNTDEYSGEADVIIIRFNEARDEKQLAAIIKQVFVSQFDEKLANNPKAIGTYIPMASEIWTVMTDSKI